MDIDQYKAEGARLAKHLATRHGIKLKHASILEAVAAMHGAKDWNTLLGGKRTRPGLLDTLRSLAMPEASQVSACEVHIGRKLKRVRAEDGYILGARPELVKFPRLYLEDHMLVAGNWRTGSHTFVEALLAQHVAMGGAFVVLRAQPDEDADARLAAIMDSAERPFYRYDANSPEKSHRYDVLGNDASSHLKVMELIRPLWQSLAAPTFATTFGDSERPHWDYILLATSAICEVLRHLGKPYSLSDIATLLTSWEACEKILHALPGGASAYPNFANFTQRRSPWTSSKPLQEVSSALKAFCDTQEGRKLDGYDFHFDLDSARQERAGVVLSPPEVGRDADIQRFRRLFVEDVLTKLHRMRYEDLRWKTPLMVVIEDAAELGTEKLRALLRAAQLKSTIFVMMADSLDTWRRQEPRLPDELLELCANHVFFRLSPADVEFLSERSLTYSNLLGDDRQLPRALEELERLGYREAWVRGKYDTAKVTTPHVTFENRDFEPSVISPAKPWRLGQPLRIRQWEESRGRRDI